MTNEEYIERATTFDGYEAPATERPDGRRESLKSHYNRLSILNSLDYNGKWEDKVRQTAKNGSDIIDAVASQLELTDYQKQEAHHRFTDISERRKQGNKTHMIALCVCGIVGVEDGRDYHPNHVLPHTPDSAFGDFAVETGLRHSELYSCWESVRGDMK